MDNTITRLIVDTLIFRTHIRSQSGCPMKKEKKENEVALPKAVALKAANMPWKENARVDVSPYQEAILALRERGYSYGEIAEWLAKEINAPVKRGQVYYVYQSHLAEVDARSEEARERGTLRSWPAPKLSVEEAERKAAEADAKKKP